MKNYIRILTIITALMFGTVSGAWAQFNDSDIEIEVKPNALAGTVAKNVNATTREVTLTVTPASGYYIKTSDIVVEKLLDPGSANAPMRRSSEITDVIVGKMYSGSGRTDEDIISSVANPNSAQYVFTVPNDYDGAYVTATFHLQTENDIIRITASTDLGDNPDMTKHYVLVEDISASVVEKLNSATAFTGVFEGEAQADGTFPKIMNLSKPLFNTATNATIRNILLDGVIISQSGKTGSIACTANGTTSIYNCGILSGSVGSIGSSSADNSTDCCGGLVGFLDGSARVVNCYSYATITGGNRVAGIVGYNNNTTTSSSTNLKTMVMNCMFYGDITGGQSKAPVYHGKKITNLGNNSGVGSYNYFNAESSYVKNNQINMYYCALMAEKRFLQRFEFYRYLLNSHRELAAWWATGDRTNKDLMAKWVLEPSQIGSEHPYPILKAQGYYPSVVNIDAKNATTQAERNKGGKLGTLSVNIRMGSGGEQFGSPTGATITTPYLTLNITDKDYDHFNFNYYKVQLPYYNEVGTGNYTGNRVVTGWKIVSITGGTPGTFTSSSYDATVDNNGNITSAPYNFADRYCTNKDLYGSGGSNRVFSQGAYWDVPEGVTAITIEPYWAKAAYVADANADVVYNVNMTTAYNVPNVGGGQIYTNGVSTFNEEDDQLVYTSIANAVTALSPNSSHTVNDYAVVLVGNYHEYSGSGKTIGDGKPYTVTSVDLDNDDEPDYSFMWRFDGRTKIHPVKYDFLNLVGLGMAQKSTTSKGSYNFGIPQPLDWFEVTNTALFRVTQMEYSPANRVKKPIIMQGGVIEQWVTQQQEAGDKVEYFHVGGNAWFKEFHRGSHQDNSGKSTAHPPLSVTGGDFDKFYLTGAYQPLANNYNDDAECYINGGRFGTVAGAGMEGIGHATNHTKGNIIWQIDNADIEEFYGGGINGEKPIQGNITTVIRNSYVGLFCGGPKFGDMNSGRTVKTTATDCHFGTYFGAGYGGNSYYRAAPGNFTNTDDPWKSTEDKEYNLNWNEWVAGTIKATINDGNYPGGIVYNGYNQEYISNFGGVSTGIDYQFLPKSGNAQNVGRLFVDFVSFSLATTRDVTSKLTGCTITGNFYGGGNLGKVEGPVSSMLTDCKVDGSVFGAGYSASLPTVSVMKTTGFKVEPNYDKETGVFMPGTLPDYEPDVYHWEHADVVNSTETAIDKDNHILYTTKNLDGLGAVTGKATLTINGTTTVTESVYGGGEESGVGGDTEVNVNGGSIGAEGRSSYGYRYGNVYGGGKGKIDNEGNLAVSSKDDLDAGYVKGNTSVTINGTKETTKIVHNVYGGGAVGSVGTFTRDANGNPTACTSGGQATVTINGGTIGHDRKDSGMVNGSSRGWEGNPEGSFLDQLAWVNNAIVTIGDATTNDEDKGPAILGSVYGGGENGHNYSDGSVTINKGTIGNAKESANEYDCGNVYGAGCGTDTYWIDANGNGSKDEGEEHHNQKAGLVRGKTTVTVNGGNVLRNIYGGGSMGSVGNDTDAESGKTTININGGTIGRTEDSDHGHVFGGPKGNLTETEFKASVKSTLVNINAHPSDANKNPIVYGSVFGGGEAGIVKGSVAVNMIGGTVKKDVYGGGALADTQTSNWDATANGGAGGWASGKTSASATTTVRLTGGDILGEAYGGGLGETGKPAYVYGNVLLDLNGTTTSGEEGTTIAESARGCAVNEVFGCNNAAGTPMGQVLVHIYATQNKDKSQIGNTDGETPVTDAKTKGSYDVKAVYGGGNLAAFEPAGGKETTYSTKVIIDGCGLTSIQTVYGGGNAASAPATNVIVNGTFEIEELFGGGNGKDNIVLDGITLPNPGANVGYKNYSEFYQENNVWKVRDKSDYDTKEERTAEGSDITYGSGQASINVFGGTIHRVFGGSNTKGNVRQTAVTLLDENSGCDFCVDEAYGGGKSAEMDAEAKLLMACIPGLRAAYGGAEAAAIKGNVTLTITNGTFDRVFGGNNLSGTISGAITVNVEEVGCRPIIIGELYGGGNQAAYSIYGYNGDDTPKTEGANPSKNPEVNVKSFTSIGKVFGGGYGSGATMVGNPTVNVNEVYGKYYNDDKSIVGENAETPNHYPIPSHAKGKMGAISEVFGGGNAAEVQGNTTVNIGTTVGDDIYMAVPVAAGTDLTSGGYYTLSGNTYTEVTSGTASADVTYYKKYTVLGVDIRGNVYGGGNNADVTGNATVNVGKKATSEP